MFAGFAYTERVPVRAATVLYEVGNTWMIAFLYLLLVFLLADIASLCHLLPKTLLKDSAAGLLGAVGIVALIMTLGAIHYPHKYREELTIETDKPLEQPLTIVLASDLHIGYHNRKAELARWVDLINAEKPDLVLIGGDIIDRSLRPVTEGRYEEEFRRLEAPVWTVLGNHETYAGLPQAEQFFEAAGIRVLKDSVAHFKGVDVIGRKDRSTPGRAALRDLADGLEGFTLVRLHPRPGPPAEPPGRSGSGGRRLPVQRPHPPRPALARLLGHRPHVREILGPLPQREHPLLHLLRPRPLGRQDPRRHPFGVPGPETERKE